MQTCPVCGFRSLVDERVVDPDTGRDRGSRTVCKKCGHIERDDTEV